MSIGFRRVLVATLLIVLHLPSYAAEHQLVTIVTNHGDITVQLFRDDAPMAVEHFMDLVLSGKYDGQRFYRVVAGKFIQGGIGYDKARKEPTVPRDHHAWHHNIRGAIGFAREELNNPDSGTTEFYICVDDLPSLDKAGFESFGRVIKGFGVLNTISSLPVRKKWMYWNGKSLSAKTSKYGMPVAWDQPYEPVIIESIRMGPGGL